MKSIRTYLVSRLLVGAAVVLGVAGTAVYAVVAESLEAQFDENLTDRVQGFAAMLFQAENRLEFEYSDELMPEFAREEAPSYFELWLDDGRLIERSTSLDQLDLVLPTAATDAPQHWTATLPDGRRGRFASQRTPVHHVYPEEGPDRPEPAIVVICIARGLADPKHITYNQPRIISS